MTSMPNGTVQLVIDDGVAMITLDRPDTLNSMNNDFMDDIRSAVEMAEADQDARVIVVTGAGRGFCSGADLSAMGDPEGQQTESSALDEASAVDDMGKHFNPTVLALRNSSLPTVARINGVAAGGGVGLAMSCDVSIAARSAFFVATFGPRLGIVPDLGTTWALPKRIGRARALGMAMLGDRIPAELAADWGLIYSVVDDDKLDAEVGRATDILKRSSAAAVARIRSSIDTASTRDYADQLDLERDHQAVLIPLNMSEGAAAFVEKRDPVFE